MFRFIAISCLLSVALALPANNNYFNDQYNQAEGQNENIQSKRQTQRLNNVETDAEILAREREQNESAHYSFDASVQDDINDGAFKRSETRDGTKTSGMYSYSDGYVHRTVHYEADENGYRVTKEETENIGEGPVFNAAGQADVSGSLIGKYSIRLNQNDSEKHYKDINA